MISCGEYAAFLMASAGRLNAVMTEVTELVIVSAVDRARESIGKYQPGWERLSGATLEGFHHVNGKWIPGKIELGYSPPDNPLLRRGDLRDSIEGEVDGPMGVVGSTSKVALYQEMGTPGAEYPIPPRPFLAKALLDTLPEAKALLEEAAVALLVPGRL